LIEDYEAADDLLIPTIALHRASNRIAILRPTITFEFVAQPPINGHWPNNGAFKTSKPAS
jgi:hypothetical protein